MEHSGGNERRQMHKDATSMEKLTERLLHINVFLYFHFHASYLIWALQCFTVTLAILDKQSKTSLVVIHPYVDTGFDFHCFSGIQALYC